MTEMITTKIANGALRALGHALRAAEFEYKRGSGGSVVLDDGAENGLDPLARRRSELLEELAAIDKERAAR